MRRRRRAWPVRARRRGGQARLVPDAARLRWRAWPVRARRRGGRARCSRSCCCVRTRGRRHRETDVSSGISRTYIVVLVRSRNVLRERSCAAAVGGRAGRAVVADAAAEDPVNRIPALMMIERTACCCDAKRRSCASRAATRYHEDAQARGRVPETRGRRGEDSARADNRASHATKVFRGHGTPTGRLRPPRRPSLQTTPAGHT